PTSSGEWQAACHALLVTSSKGDSLITNGIPSSSIPSSTSCQRGRHSFETAMTIAGVEALTSISQLLLPGEQQTRSDSIAWTFGATNIAASGNQTVMGESVSNQLWDFEVQRRTANQHHKRNVADIAGRANLA